MKKTAQLLKSDGRTFFIFHAERKDDFFQAVKKNELMIKSLRYVHPRKASPPNLFLTECNFFSKKVTTLPPFILYNKQGKYMKEAEEIFRGRNYTDNS
jgi:tRNA1(Val) A37 N6-methylase TrmN6